nr:immunoglobulin heavy chain junction region [Macaca mulatta]MOX95125.1 immunoglobulin heavy chain junction region [Macaca mulatta]MOX95754.1 immunoglobulin heavy chain junction region [Macaca mulatta]MOX96772.1 immunoglobulin heavy chain junction region [Macaca mulatta]
CAGNGKMGVALGPGSYYGLDSW